MCVSLKDTTSGTDEQERTCKLPTRRIQIISSSLPSIPLQFIPASKKSEQKDPKHVRQEMSRAGKRMWSEESGLWGRARANRPHRSGRGKGSLGKKKGNLRVNRLRLVSGRFGIKHLPQKPSSKAGRGADCLRPAARKEGAGVFFLLSVREGNCTKPTWQS